MSNGKVNKIHNIEINEGDAIVVMVNGTASVVLLHTETQPSIADPERPSYHFTAAGVSVKVSDNLHGFSTLGSVGTCGSGKPASEHPSVSAVITILDIAKTWSWIK